MKLNWSHGNAPFGIKVIDHDRGGELVEALWADDEKGEYECLLLRNGHPYADDKGDGLVSERRKGRIEFIFPSEDVRKICVALQNHAKPH